MQKLSNTIIGTAKKLRIRKLEKDLEGEIKYREDGELFLCPFCKYESKKNRKGTAKIFRDGKNVSFKCFACGKWRKIK